jgi:hypothetical protein
MTTPKLPFAGLRRVQSLARWVRALCLIGLFLCVAAPALMWSQPDLVAEVVHRHWGIPEQAPLRLDALGRLLGLLASLPPSALLGLALHQVWALFGRYARGDVWCAQSISHLRRAALASTALAPALPLSKTLTVLALTFGNPPGQRMLHFGLGLQDLLALLLGLVLLAVATVMAEAVRMAEENAEFV